MTRSRPQSSPRQQPRELYESRLVSPARMIGLGRTESLAMLADAPMGRIGFTQHALLVIRPVNHLVDGDTIALRTYTGSALLRNTPIDEVVVYEADQLDVHRRTGWSLMVTGRHPDHRTPVTRYRQLLVPWIDMAMDHIVRISAELVTGYRLER